MGWQKYPKLLCYRLERHSSQATIWVVDSYFDGYRNRCGVVIKTKFFFMPKFFIFSQNDNEIINNDTSSMSESNLRPLTCHAVAIPLSYN
ncbi:hypothetical protein OUZ56_020867 [Daphnia magna]|uniref:Uncharacterized protein n=1 Tax=Daphnia magna TaxID=35525 RepID=A0ABQ9ZFP1_9CRUS|nr:hypothetical protein OUZ56_020867 [Daphnia magna]